MRFVVTVLIAFISLVASALAERVTVKYRGVVDITKFDCPPLKSSSFVNRVCYDKANQYMIILLQSTYYHYCEIDAATVRDLIDAPSLGRYFNANIKGNFDCRTKRVPSY
jgi:hypothetical protein